MSDNLCHCEKKKFKKKFIIIKEDIDCTTITNENEFDDVINMCKLSDRKCIRPKYHTKTNDRSEKKYEDTCNTGLINMALYRENINYLLNNIYDIQKKI